MNIEFSEQEGRALLQLIDIAVKAGGLQIAHPALFWATKVETAIKEQKPKLEAVAN